MVIILNGVGISGVFDLRISNMPLTSDLIPEHNTKYFAAHINARAPGI